MVEGFLNYVKRFEHYPKVMKSLIILDKEAV